MFIFLGLNAKPTEIAWMSFLILIVTCGYSIFWFDKIETEQANFSKSPSFQEAIQLREDLAELHCTLHRMTQNQCAKLESLAKAKILFETDYLLKFYENKQDSKTVGGLREQFSSDPIKTFLDLLEYGGREENRTDLSDARYSKIYSHYSYIKNQTLESYKAFLKSHQLLSKISITPLNLFRANFLHGGWLHLIGNMLFFIVFAIFVECRLGALLTLFIYLVGGSIGMFLQTKFFMEPTIHLIGASGCVSAILGASLALFSRQKVKVWVTLLFYNRVLLVPAMVALPFLTLAQDFIGAFDSTTNVGHIAHLGGFCSGFLMAQFFGSIDIVPKEFIFPEEYRLFKVFKKSTEFRIQILALKKLISINSENAFVLNQATEWFTKELLKHPGFFKNHVLFISETIGISVRAKLREETPVEVVKYLSQLPASLNYTLVFKYVPISLRLGVQNLWLERRRISLSIAENLEVENQIPPKDAQDQWNKIMNTLESEITQISERERDEIVAIFDFKRSRLPDHAFLNRLDTQIKALKERSYVKAA